MNQLYILLGSNQQNPQKQLQLAQKLIKKKLGHIIRQSAVYLTKAWGNTHQPDFLNQVIIVHTSLAAEKSMQLILFIEKEMGRIRTIKNAPRLIDIDILFFNKEIINTTSLQVPHPRIQDRHFVLVPLNELSPQFKHPVLNKPIHQLLKICTDDLPVNKI